MIPIMIEWLLRRTTHTAGTGIETVPTGGKRGHMIHVPGQTRKFLYTALNPISIAC